jgi:hypothetical protein
MSSWIAGEEKRVFPITNPGKSRSNERFALNATIEAQDARIAEHKPTSRH